MSLTEFEKLASETPQLRKLIRNLESLCSSADQGAVFVAQELSVRLDGNSDQIESLLSRLADAGFLYRERSLRCEECGTWNSIDADNRTSECASCTRSMRGGEETLLYRFASRRAANDTVRSANTRIESVHTVTMTRPLKWLHVSDIHLRTGKDRYDSDLVLSALIHLVKANREEHDMAPDIVFCSGDLAYGGKEEEYKMVSAFFSDLLVAAGLEGKRERLIVVPGNHDVDRSAAVGLERTLPSEARSQEYFAENQPFYHMGKFSHFRKWFDGFFAETGRIYPAKSTCGPFIDLVIEGTRVAITPINTALFAQDDEDREKLWVGRRCLHEFWKKNEALKHADIRFSMMHHPVDWLSPLESSHIKSTLRTHTDILLSGHLHDQNAERSVTPDSEMLVVTAGAGYQGSEWPNRCLYGEWDGIQCVLRPFRYVDEREEWVDDTGLFPRREGYVGRFPLVRGRKS